MCYLGFAWSHALGGNKRIVSEPTAYLRRNLKELFQALKINLAKEIHQSEVRQIPVLLLSGEHLLRYYCSKSFN